MAGSTTLADWERCSSSFTTGGDCEWGRTSPRTCRRRSKGWRGAHEGLRRDPIFPFFFLSTSGLSSRAQRRGPPCREQQGAAESSRAAPCYSSPLSRKGEGGRGGGINAPSAAAHPPG